MLPPPCFSFISISPSAPRCCSLRSTRPLLSLVCTHPSLSFHSHPPQRSSCVTLSHFKDCIFFYLRQHCWLEYLVTGVLQASATSIIILISNNNNISLLFSSFNGHSRLMSQGVTCSRFLWRLLNLPSRLIISQLPQENGVFAPRTAVHPARSAC